MDPNRPPNLGYHGVLLYVSQIEFTPSLLSANVVVMLINL